MIKDSAVFPPSLEFTEGMILMSGMSINTISAQDLPNILQQGQLVIDVRSPAEFRAEHVTGAKLHPLDKLDAAAFGSGDEAAAPIYILCQSGKRASMAAEKFAAAGRGQVYVVEGGTNAAREAGVSIELGKGMISIERQVRIGAGALVATGCLAGLLLHPGFFAVPIFVGCGLVFAGITDICGMGVLLAKMPWNSR